MKSKTINILTWVAQGLLSLILLPAIPKLILPYEELVAGVHWTEDFSSTQVMIIGVLEILGVIGLNLPFLLNKFKKLVPIAAIGLALIMAGAIVTHICRGENFILPGVLFIIALFVVFARKDLLKASAGQVEKED